MTRRSLLRKLAVSLVTIAVCLAALEAYARRTYEPVLDFRDVEPYVFGKFTPKRNEFKFREDPVEPELLEPDVTRVLFLGDSFTFGFGVRDGAERFTDRIEARLNEEAGAGIRAGRYHLYNAGVSGTGPTDWVEHWKLLAPTYRPTHVVAVFFLRCGTSLGTSLRYHARRITAIKKKYNTGFLYRNSYLARSILDRRISREFTAQYKQSFLDAYLGDARQKGKWIAEREKLVELRDLCAEAGMEFTLVIFPLLLDLEEYRFGPVEAEIAEFATRSGISVFSLIGGFQGREAARLWVSENDQHPNALGHEVAAETLYPYLVERFGFEAH